MTPELHSFPIHCYCNLIPPSRILASTGFLWRLMCLPITTRRKGTQCIGRTDNPVKDFSPITRRAFSHSRQRPCNVDLHNYIDWNFNGHFARLTFVKTLDLWVHLSSYNELSLGPKSADGVWTERIFTEISRKDQGSPRLHEYRDQSVI